MLNICMLAWMLKKRDERFKKLKTLPYQKKKKDLRRLCFSITGAVSLKDWGTFTSSIRMRRCLLTCMHKGLAYFLVSPFIFDLSSCDNCSFQSFFSLWLSGWGKVYLISQCQKNAHHSWTVFCELEGDFMLSGIIRSYTFYENYILLFNCKICAIPLCVVL